MVRLTKNGQECHVEDGQVEAMKASGWVDPDEASQPQGASDGGEQQPGRQLDQEHGPGEDRQGPVDDPKRVKQLKGKQRNGPEGG